MDAVNVGSPEPPLSCSVQDRYASIASHGEIVSHRPGSIGGSIVDDENTRFRDLEELLNEVWEILALVVRRDDNQRPHDP
jgi:hypothetical protein